MPLRLDLRQVRQGARAHGLVREAPESHRYLVTDRGRVAISAEASAARAADAAKLAAAARQESSREGKNCTVSIAEED